MPVAPEAALGGAGEGLGQAGAALPASGRRLVVLGPAERDDGLVRDVTRVLNWFCVRLNGRRPARNRAGKALRCAARDTGPAAAEVTG